MISARRHKSCTEREYPGYDRAARSKQQQHSKPRAQCNNTIAVYLILYVYIQIILYTYVDIDKGRQYY